MVVLELVYAHNLPRNHVSGHAIISVEILKEPVLVSDNSFVRFGIE